MQPITPETEALIDRALAEDTQGGDVTTNALIPRDLMGEARLVSEEDGVLSGVETALAVFRRVDPAVETHADLADGRGTGARNGNRVGQRPCGVDPHGGADGPELRQKA